MDILGNKAKIEENDNIDLLVCARIKTLPKSVYGSIRGQCVECNEAVWVSLSGQKALRESDKLKVFCMECSFVRMENDDDVKAQIVPGAIEELKRYFLKVENN